MAEEKSYKDCPLCGLPMDNHTVRSVKVRIDGRDGLKPVGWDCPVKPSGR